MADLGALQQSCGSCPADSRKYSRTVEALRSLRPRVEASGMDEAGFEVPAVLQRETTASTETIEMTDYRAGRRCYTYRGVHIPGCWGCVIYGHSACTCRSPKQEDLLSKMNMLERRIAELEDAKKFDGRTR